MSTALHIAPLGHLTERQFQQQVTDLAAFTHWKVYHTWLSIRSTKGFPDLVLVKPGRLLFREIKSERGVVTADQREWLDLLTGAGADVAVWRPSDWARIVETLQTK